LKIPVRHCSAGNYFLSGTSSHTHWHPLAPTGTHWHPLAPTGTHWHPLAQVLQLQPSNWRACLNRGVALLGLGEMDQGHLELTKVLQMLGAHRERRVK
jgi:hypothetical protein